MGNFWLLLAGKMATGTYHFVYLIVKIKSLESAWSFPTPAEAKTQCFVHLSFNSTWQVISDISNDCQKIPFLMEELLHFLELFPSAAVFSNNLALHLKDLKALVFATLESKLVAPSLE